MSPRIAIIGAGPAGLTLARLLHLNSPDNPSFVVFEKDASATVRQWRGGTVDLRDGTGLAAINAASLREEFLKYARYDGQSVTMSDNRCNHFLTIRPENYKKGGWTQSPEIDRETLRDMLLESIPSEFVKWGCHLTSVSSDGILTFKHGKEGPFELVVGSDGAFSKVRHVLTDVRPRHAGVSGLELRLRQPNLRPKVSDMIGLGSYFAFSKGQSMMGQRLSDNSIMIYTWCARTPESYPENLIAECGGDVSKIKEKLLAQFSTWLPEYLEWIEAVDSDMVRPWPLFELPVGHTWEHKKGFTLIGDAAHVMTPFAGQGTNAAMKDGLDLAQAITSTLRSGGDMDDAVKKYEDAMFPRAKSTAADTMENKTLLFREDAPAGMFEKAKHLVQMAAGPGAPEP